MSVESGSGGIPEFVVVGTVSDSLKVTVTVTPKATGDCVGESKTFTMTVYDEVSLSMDLGRDTIICRFDTLRLNATHSNALSYLWQDNTATPDYTVTKEGIYWVTLKGACKSEAHDTVKISYFEDIVVNLGKDTTFCKGDVIYIPLDVTNPYASYLWQPSGDDSPVYVIQEAGVYSVEVSNACTSVTKEITISEIDCSFDFTIPNIFTPNGDGLNELFAPEFIPLENLGEFQMYIYDRWGRLVFSTESYETLWDGNNKNGKPYTDGIYYYYLSFTHKVLKDKEYKHHGTLTLIRN
jgi:gliding motility-associated-like protein